MPLLKREEEISPSELFALNGLAWTVALTRSRQEKALARYLAGRRLAFYLPLLEKRVTWRGRVRTSFLPLFPGYVFLRGDAAARLSALQSRLIVRTLEVPDQELLGRELGELRRLQLSGARIAPVTALEPGDPVRIAEGPFAGYTGVLLRERPGQRLLISITMIQKAVVVELGPQAVRPLPDGVFTSAETRSAVA